MTRVEGDDASETEEVWRASLESARTRERWMFRSLDDAFDFLRGQVDSSHGEAEKERSDRQQ